MLIATIEVIRFRTVARLANEIPIRLRSVCGVPPRGVVDLHQKLCPRRDHLGRPLREDPRRHPGEYMARKSWSSGFPDV